MGCCNWKIARLSKKQQKKFKVNLLIKIEVN